MTDYIFYATLFRKNETYNPTCLVLHSLRNVNGCFISVTLWRVYLLCCSDVLTSHTTGMCRSFSVSESTEKFVKVLRREITDLKVMRIQYFLHFFSRGGGPSPRHFLDQCAQPWRICFQVCAVLLCITWVAVCKRSLRSEHVTEDTWRNYSVLSLFLNFIWLCVPVVVACVTIRRLG